MAIPLTPSNWPSPGPGPPPPAIAVISPVVLMMTNPGADPTTRTSPRTATLCGRGTAILRTTRLSGDITTTAEAVMSPM
jgi:hypothetical protein